MGFLELEIKTLYRQLDVFVWICLNDISPTWMKQILHADLCLGNNRKEQSDIMHV